MNSLGYESINEVFFDVFEIKSNGIDLIKEKKEEINGNPIVELDLSIDNEVYKNVRFVLNENGIIKINPNLLDYTKAVIYEKKQIKKPKPITEKIEPKIVQEIPEFKPKKVISERKQIIKEKTLIEKTKENFFGSIKTELIHHLKEEIKAGIIADLLKDNIQDNFDNFLGESVNQIRLQKYFQNENNKFRKELIEISEKIARRESIRFGESGGGTNAVQYKNGGTIDGILNINGDLIVNGQKAIKRVVFDIGDGINKSFTFTHNLDSKNILVNVQDATNDEIVLPYVKLTDNNTIFVEFSFIPNINNYRLIIFG